MSRPVTYRYHDECTICAAPARTPCIARPGAPRSGVPIRWHHRGRPLLRRPRDRREAVAQYLDLHGLVPEWDHRRLSEALGMTVDAMRLALTRSGRWRNGKLYTPGLTIAQPRG